MAINDQCRMWVVTSWIVIPKPPADGWNNWLTQHTIHILPLRHVNSHNEAADGLKTQLRLHIGLKKGFKKVFAHTCTKVYLQFEHSWTLAQHHLDEVPVVDSVAAATRHLNNHFFQFQVGLGHPQLLHHSLQTHHIWDKVQLTIRSVLRWIIFIWPNTYF